MFRTDSNSMYRRYLVIKEASGDDLSDKQVKEQMDRGMALRLKTYQRIWSTNPFFGEILAKLKITFLMPCKRVTPH